MYVQAGGGVVADSDPDAEYKETVYKAQALLAAAEEAVRFASRCWPEAAGNSCSGPRRFASPAFFSLIASRQGHELKAPRLNIFHPRLQHFQRLGMGMTDGDGDSARLRQTFQFPQAPRDFTAAAPCRPGKHRAPPSPHDCARATGMTFDVGAVREFEK